MTVHIGPYAFDRVRYDHDADVLYLAQGDPARAVDFDETPEGHAVSFDEDGDLVGLTLIDIRRLLDGAQGEALRLELPAKASRPQARPRIASDNAWRKTPSVLDGLVFAR